MQDQKTLEKNMRREDPIDVRYEIISQDAGPEAVLHDTDPEFADDMSAAEETAVSPYDMSSVLSRSNILILTKYKATNIESKLLLMTLYEAQKSAGTMPIQFSTQQLLSAMKLNKSSYIYDQIKTASVGISKTQFWYEDPRSRHFFVVNLIESAEYKNGILEIKLTDWAKSNIYELKSNFTPMLMPVLMNFGTSGKRTEKTNYTLRMYEILRTKLFRCSEERPRFTFKILLTDLKITLGCIDPSDPGIERVISRGKALNLPDDELEKYATKKESVAFKRYSAFSERVLKKAQKEINEGATDLEFTYREERVGKTVKYVIFTIWRSLDFMSEEDENRMYKMIQEVERIIPQAIKTKDIKRILSAAGNNLEKVRNAYELSTRSARPIENLTAWMIAAIRDDWKMADDMQDYPIEKGRLYDMRQAANQKEEQKRKKKKNTNPFNNFQQNEYDFDQLEKELLGM